MPNSLGNINENTSCTIQCVFEDESGATFIPTSATYKINSDTAVIIVGVTTFTPPNISITAAQNALLGNKRNPQKRYLTVSWVYGTKSGYSDCTYTILPLAFGP
jgi:hypothetical protein